MNVCAGCGARFTYGEHEQPGEGHTRIDFGPGEKPVFDSEACVRTFMAKRTGMPEESIGMVVSSDGHTQP